VEDALARVLQQASAKKISLDVTINDGSILLIMEDDGEVNTQAEAGAPWQLALSSMRQRIKALGGSLEMRSGPKQGTVLEVSVPWVKAAA
jgi:signal transduction histidine kinase